MHMSELGWDFGSLASFTPPAAAATHWPELCDLLFGLRQEPTAWPGQVARVRRWYPGQSSHARSTVARARDHPSYLEPLNADESPDAHRKAAPHRSPAPKIMDSRPL